MHPQLHTASAQAASALPTFPVLASHIQDTPLLLRPSTAFGRWEASRVAWSSTSLQLVVRCQAGSDGAPSAKAVTVPSIPGADVAVKVIVTVQEPGVNFFTNVVNKALDGIGDLFGKSLLLDFVSAELDPKTGLEKRAVTTFAHKGTDPGNGCVAYEADFTLPAGFGEVGAILVENEHHKEMFVRDIVLKRSDYDEPVNIRVESWVHSKFDDPDKRIFFTNKSYLPSQTPAPLRKLRLQELIKLRGDSQGMRKPYDRIYDYDVYNDLGDPDKSKDLARPVLGGKKHPYPRRCRTGRPMCKSDPHTESRVGHTYVPRDEQFAAVKQSTFSITTLRSVLHAVVPGLESVLLDPKLPFDSFREIDSLFNEGLTMPKTEGIQQVTGLLPSLLKVIADRADSILQFELPALHDKDRFSWLRDEEFSRQTLAGLNPVCIELVREFPFVSKLDPKVYGPPESAITKEIIEREIRSIMTVEEAIEQKRLFILDYHDVFLPYVNKIREVGNTTAYGSRTIFFRHHDDCLEPIVIELTRPPSKTQPQWKQAFTHCYDATGAWLWRLAKLHATTHDTGFHQLVSHWLRTHCCVEPYAIAANRQLSAMHPVYRLLEPHFRYTMEINALAREALISAGGIIETSFFPGKYAIELSSVAYDKLWRFDMEALPADLVRRGLAVEDPEAEHGLKLVIEDYPYANDGLLIWSVIEQWVQDYVSHYYPDAETVTGDRELQAWWHEVRNKGHADKKDEPWWPQLDGTASLVRTLTTIIWVTSCHHAAVNFGQYHYGGYFPNRPTVVRRNIPIEEGGESLKSFMNKPERSLLDSLPSQLQATVVMAILDVLSSHSPDEEYIGKQAEHWAAEPIIRAAYERFAGRLQEIEGIIDDRNLNPKLKNRFGAGVVPYELLKPTSEPGVTGRGIPNSISI